MAQVACHWFDFVDPAVSLVLAIGIGLSVVPLVRRALPILLDAVPPGEDPPTPTPTHQRTHPTPPSLSLCLSLASSSSPPAFALALALLVSVFV